MYGKKISSKYTKYLVKNPFIFYGVLMGGIIMFLYLTGTTFIETDGGVESLLNIIITKAGRGI